MFPLRRVPGAPQATSLLTAAPPAGSNGTAILGELVFERALIESMEEMPIGDSFATWEIIAGGMDSQLREQFGETD